MRGEELPSAVNNRLFSSYCINFMVVCCGILHVASDVQISKVKVTGNENVKKNSFSRIYSSKVDPFTSKRPKQSAVHCTQTV